MKIAIVHYWMVSMRGGEKVVEALCKSFPEADILTHVYVKELLSQDILRHKITTSFISRLPFSKKLYKRYLPLMPIALEELDLRDYDVVISSEAGPAKGVVSRADALHICYCHTPMRYVWNMYHDYKERSGVITPVWQCRFYAIIFGLGMLRPRRVWGTSLPIRRRRRAELAAITAATPMLFFLQSILQAFI